MTGWDSALVVAVPLVAVVPLEIDLQFAESGLDLADEGFATLGMAAHGDDGVAFGVVVGDGEDFAVGAEAVGDPLDHVVGGLALARVEDFDLWAGGDLGDSGGGTLAIEEDGEGNPGHVLVAGELVDQCLACLGGVGGMAGCQRVPGVEEAVAVDEDADEGHQGGGWSRGGGNAGKKLLQGD